MKKVVQDLGNEALLPPVNPEVMAATEDDWKCRYVSCRLPATHMVTILADDNTVKHSYLVCMIHAEE